MMIAKKNLAQNLKRFRKLHHMNRLDFATDSGVCEDSIRLYEQERGNPQLDTLCAIAACMGISVDELLKEGEE